MKAEDRVRLQHMLDAGREAMSFAEDRTRADLDTDRKLVLALVKCIEIVGEAASQVSAETQAATPELPWTQMTAMRHRLVHAYYDVDLDVVWSTLQEDLPQLVRAVGAALEAS